jgi:hypothetical protein
MCTCILVAAGRTNTSNETRTIASSVARPLVSSRTHAVHCQQRRARRNTIVTHNTVSSSRQFLYTRATRTVYLMSMLTVCLQCTMHDTPATLGFTEHTSIHIVARGRHSQCTKQLAGVAPDSDFNVQYNTMAQNSVCDALKATGHKTYVSSVRLPMLSGMIPRMLRQHMFNTVLRKQQSTRAAQCTSACDSHALVSRSHSHAAVCRSATSRACHARPAVVTRVTAYGVVLPAGVDAPRAASGGNVEVHECSPLSSSGGGHDAHSDTPLDRRAHVQNKPPPRALAGESVNRASTRMRSVQWWLACSRRGV